MLTKCVLLRFRFYVHASEVRDWLRMTQLRAAAYTDDSDEGNEPFEIGPLMQDLLALIANRNLFNNTLALILDQFH